MTDWHAAIETLIGAGTGCIVVLGERDVGKSTFCEGLLRQAAGQGIPALLVDADVGQKSVGPPACVTLGRFAGGGRAECLALAFVGTVSPVQGRRRLMEGVELLCRSRTGLLIVNTDGLLAGPGLRQKTEMIGRCGADRLVTIGEHPDIERIAEADPAIPVVRVATSPGAVRKTEGVRRANRSEAFQSYFDGARECVLDLDTFTVEGDERRMAHPRLLVGLTDGRGRDFALGIVTRYDPGAVAATLLTPATQSEFQGMRLGMMLVDEQFKGTVLPAAARQALGGAAAVGNG